MQADDEPCTYEGAGSYDAFIVLCKKISSSFVCGYWDPEPNVRNVARCIFDRWDGVNRSVCVLTKSAMSRVAREEC